MTQNWYLNATQALDEDSRQQAQQRQEQLTKPLGSLGQLESVAIHLAAMQGRVAVNVNNVRIVIFAADHGVAAEGVSAFPQVVTTEMIKNFSRGGAAISVLARQLAAELEVIDVGSAHPVAELSGVIDARIAAGTANFAKQAAMTDAQCLQALSIGKDAVIRAQNNGCDIFIGGEMGIANTTSASALACVWLGKAAHELVGPGTGLSSEGVKHKAQVIDQAILFHKDRLDDPLSVLSTLGGFEIAALAGAYIGAAQVGLPVLIDGFISSVAALAANRLNPGVIDWCLFAHRSAEPGHARVVEALDASPLLDLDMRLGEGSGAAVAMNVLQSACALHNQMATFAEAGVSTSDV